MRGSQGSETAATEEALQAFGLRYQTAWTRGMRAKLGILEEQDEDDVLAQMTPDTFLARLCALVPPPRAHTVLYYGVLSAHHKLRSAIVPRADEPEPKQLSLFIPRGQLELPAITTLRGRLSEMKWEIRGRLG